MRQLFSLVLLSLLYSLALTQRPYQPMVVEGATWVEKRIGADFGIPYYMAFYLEGDSILDGRTYKKLYSQSAAYNQFPQESYRLVGNKYFQALLREDTTQRKVYVFYEKGQCFPFPNPIGEFVLYDFSLQLQDTFTNCIREEVDSVIFKGVVGPIGNIAKGVDSVVSVRLVPVTQTPNVLRAYYEVFGNRKGILNGKPEAFSGLPVSASGSLVLYCKNPGVCQDLITSIEPHKPQSQHLTIFPNPVHRGEQLLLNQPFASLKLISLTGKAFPCSLLESSNDTYSWIFPHNIETGLYTLIGSDSRHNSYYHRVLISE